MKAKKILFATIPAVVLALTACGGGGGGGSSGSSVPPDTAISTTTDGTRAASAGTNGALLASNSTVALSNLASMAGVPALRSPLASKDPKFAKLNSAQAKAWQAPTATLAAAISKARGTRTVTTTNQTVTCDTGTGSVSSTVDDVAGTFSATITYTNCRVQDTEWNGTVALSGNATLDGAGNATALNMSSSISGFTATFYNVSNAVIADFSINLTMGASVNFATGVTNLSANGSEVLHEISGGTTTGTYSVSFGNVRITATGDGVTSGSSTFNGNITQSWDSAALSPASGTISLTYYSLVFAWAQSANAGYIDWTIDGTLTTDFTPNVCFEGTFTFDTTTPVHQELATGARTAGVIVINGNTTVTYSPNTVTITVSGQSTQQTQTQFENACPIENMQAAA